MGEHPLDGEVGHLLHGGDLPGGQVHILGLVADAAHAGVHGDQDGGLLALLYGLVRDGFCVAFAHGDGGDVVFHHGVGVQVGGQAQADDLLGGAGLTEGDGLLQGGDGKDLAAVVPQHLGAGHGAVAVGVGLDDTDDLALGADLFHDVLDVIVQVGQVDLGPDGADGFFIHGDTSFRIFISGYLLYTPARRLSSFLVAKMPKKRYAVYAKAEFSPKGALIWISVCTIPIWKWISAG